MSAYAAAPSYTKLHTPGIFANDRVSAPVFSRVRIAESGCSKDFCGSLKIFKLSLCKECKLENCVSTNLKLYRRPGKHSLRCSCLALVNPDGAVDFSEWTLAANQMLLMTSMLLTYVAGVIPSGKSSFVSGKTKVNENWLPESSSVSGSIQNDDQESLNFTWDLVKDKLLESLNSIEHVDNLGKRAVKFEQNDGKRPLSLYAVAEGPRLRLLWDSLQRLQEEVNNISGKCQNINMTDWLEMFANIIQESCQPICMGWLQKEFYLDNTKPDEVLLSIMYEKLKGDETILQKIRKSGKEDLYSEFLCFLRFGSNRKGRYYDHSVYTLHGVAILEDLVVTLADGIASIYLELISVDGNMSNEMNSVGSNLCSLSTRELQKLRNEVALYQWLHRNMEAIVSMYEDRFDLSILQTQYIEEPNKSQTKKFSWWKKIPLIRSESPLSKLSYIVISHFSMSVKRTKELRGLTGWRYYFSLFLELSDITMPMIKTISDKISSAISFFLVCLIGRSLGLIYTGIRQSLRWK